jgi:hypothetical protein
MNKYALKPDEQAPNVTWGEPGKSSVQTEKTTAREETAMNAIPDALMELNIRESKLHERRVAIDEELVRITEKLTKIQKARSCLVDLQEALTDNP